MWLLNSQEREFWQRYADYSYNFTRVGLAKVLGCSPNRVSRSRLYAVYAAVGVKPDELLIQRNDNYAS